MSPLRPGGPGLEGRSASPIDHKAAQSMEAAGKRRFEAAQIGVKRISCRFTGKILYCR